MRSSPPIGRVSEDHPLDDNARIARWDRHGTHAVLRELPDGRAAISLDGERMSASLCLLADAT
jgi:hypothetical protein